MMQINNALSTGLTWFQLAAIVVFSAITPLVMLAAPVIAGQLAVQLGLDSSQIGDLFSIELAAMSLATVAAWWWQSRLNWRTIARVAAVVFILANLASVWAGDFSTLFWLRFVSALGGGTLMVLCLSSAVASSNRDRTYSLWVCGQLVLAALALWTLPGLFAQFGLQALYVCLALLMALAFVLTGAFPVAAPFVRPVVVFAGMRPAWSRTVLALEAVLVFYIGLITVWAFIGVIAEASGLAGAAVGQILSLATIMGIAGSLTAAWIGNRGIRGVWLLLGYGLMAMSVALLFGTPGIWRFALAAVIFKYIWTFVLPYIISCIADMDSNGQLVNSMNLVIGGGLAIGPALAGRMLQPDSGLGWMGMQGMLAFSLGCLLLSFALLLTSRYRHRNATAAKYLQGVV